MIQEIEDMRLAGSVDSQCVELKSKNASHQYPISNDTNDNNVIII